MEGTGFGAVVGGSVGGVCGGGVSSGILQAVQMTEGAVAAAASVAAAAAALEVEDGCVPRGAVVGGEVGSGGVRRHCHIALVCRSGGQCGRMLLHAHPNQGGGVLYWRKRTLTVMEVEAKRVSLCKLVGSVINILCTWK